MTKIKRGLNTVVYSDNPEAVVEQEPKESTWNVMRKLDDPELQKELDAIELKTIKSKDVRFNKEVGAWTDEFSQKYNLGEAHKIRSKVRKEAGKLIKDKDQLDKFMRAKSYEEYTAGPYERILIRLKDRDNKKELLEKPKVTAEVQPTVAQSDPLFNALIQTRRELMELKKNEPKMNLETTRDPDLERGIGYLMGIKN